jgi:uncharacterized protein YbjT (DUF2867 family)
LASTRRSRAWSVSISARERPAVASHGGADRTYVVSAPRAYTFDDVASALTEVSGRTVRYTQISDEEYVANAVRSGVPEHLARRFLGFYSDIRDDQLDETSSDLATLLGRTPSCVLGALDGDLASGPPLRSSAPSNRSLCSEV